MRIDVKEVIELNDVEKNLLDQYRVQRYFSADTYVKTKNTID